MKCPICVIGELEHEFLEEDTFPEIMCNNKDCPSYNYGVLCWLSDFKSQKRSDKFLEKYIKEENLQ
jgi:hypothetical protein